MRSRNPQLQDGFWKAELYSASGSGQRGIDRPNAIWQLAERLRIAKN